MGKSEKKQKAEIDEINGTSDCAQSIKLFNGLMRLSQRS